MLTGKNVIITGARTGIGKAALELAAQNGANIWACIRNPDPEFDEYINTLALRHGGWIKAVYMDFSQEDTVKAGVKDIIGQRQRMDALVNAAGTVGENRLFQMTGINEMRRVFDVNFFGAMLLTQLVSRVMCRQNGGSIVNVVSVAGIDGDPAQLEYSASKAALINATKKLAIELGRNNIRVNAVAPGLTDTKMLDAMPKETEDAEINRAIIKRRARPAEIANAIIFFASDMSSFITGQVLRVDGGRLA